MRVSPFVIVSSALAVFLPGCGSTVEEAAPVPPPARPATTAERQEGIQFRTHADTVTALHAAETGTVGAPGRAAQVRFMVQIGAFKDPKHASAVQAAARREYRMPVLNDYLAGPGLYQIRIGFFESRESARAFREQLMREHPSQYDDSWIVQLKRR